LKSDVIDIRGTEYQGITDEVLWQKAQKEKCLLITTDKGFSIYREEPNHGFLLNIAQISYMNSLLI